MDREGGREEGEDIEEREEASVVERGGGAHIAASGGAGYGGFGGIRCGGRGGSGRGRCAQAEMSRVAFKKADISLMSTQKRVVDASNSSSCAHGIWGVSGSVIVIEF